MFGYQMWCHLTYEKRTNLSIMTFEQREKNSKANSAIDISKGQVSKCTDASPKRLSEYH